MICLLFVALHYLASLDTHSVSAVRESCHAIFVLLSDCYNEDVTVCNRAAAFNYFSNRAIYQLFHQLIG